MSEQTLKVLFSEHGGLLIDSIHILVDYIAQQPVTFITPPSAHARDLLACAAAQPLDLVILFAGNTRYDSQDHSPEGRVRAVVGLVREFVTRFKLPVVVFHPYPDSSAFSKFPDRVLEAGAAAVLQLPANFKDFEKAIKPSLPKR